jgi:hypothetical protein
MFTFTFTDLDDLIQKFEGIADNIPQEIAIANRKAGFRGRRAIAKRLAGHVRQPQKKLMKATYVKANRREVTVVIRGNFRVALKRFSPKRTNDGMTVNAYKSTLAGRNNIPGAFNTTRKRTSKKSARYVPIARFHKQPMIRKGKSRLPIQAAPAVRPVEVVTAASLLDGMVLDLESLQTKEVRSRIRFLTMKKRGQLNWQKDKT